LAMLPEDMKHLINYDEKLVLVIEASDKVVVTDQRIILRKSAGLGLRKSFVDYPYSNMVNIKLDRGLRRASVEILMRSGVQSIKIGNLTKEDAYQLYRNIHENMVRASAPHSGQPFPLLIQSADRTSHKGKDEEERVCNKCGRKVADDFSICPFCRYPLKIECPECGRKLDRKFKLCPYCGEDLSYLEEIDLEL